MVRRDLSAAVVAAALLLSGASAADLHAELGAVAARYYANLVAVAPIAGRDTTFDYYVRLRSDDETLAQHDNEMVRRTAALDLSLADQLLSGHYRQMQEIRGLGEALVRSSRDGTMQPVAVYVPQSYAPQHPASLMVLLHGSGGSETQLLAIPFLTQLAEQNGTIVVAPYGRGYNGFRGSLPDIEDTLQAALAAFTIGPRQRYLGGYSMGGFAVFEIAPAHPKEWSAIMSIAGSIMNSDAPRFVAALRNTPVYVLTGSDDETVPTQWPSATAGLLSSQGLNVSFYSQPGGQHALNTLVPILTQAWSDMLHGVTRAPPPGLQRLALPTPPPNPMRP